MSLLFFRCLDQGAGAVSFLLIETVAQRLRLECPLSSQLLLSSSVPFFLRSRTNWAVSRQTGHLQYRAMETTK